MSKSRFAVRLPPKEAAMAWCFWRGQTPVSRMAERRAPRGANGELNAIPVPDLSRRGADGGDDGGGDERAARPPPAYRRDRSGTGIAFSSPFDPRGARRSAMRETGV